MSNHTPGPWQWDYSVSIKAGSDLVALVYSTPLIGDNLDANACLIAAAPDLLDALVNLLRVIDGEGGTKPNARELARAAIAKSTGG